MNKIKHGVEDTEDQSNFRYGVQGQALGGGDI